MVKGKEATVEGKNLENQIEGMQVTDEISIQTGDVLAWSGWNGSSSQTGRAIPVDSYRCNRHKGVTRVDLEQYITGAEI